MIPGGSRPQKIDTAERLAWAVGKDPKTYESADDYNYLMNRVTALWALTFPDLSLFHPSVKIDLGTITGSFITAINTHSPRTFPEPCFVIYKIGSIDYIQAFVGFGGSYGTGAGQVIDANFILLSSSDQVQPTTPLRKIFFGKLSGTVFSEGKNTLGYPVTITQVSDYWLTNIPCFPNTVARIQDPLTIDNDSGGYVKAAWYNQGGYVAFKNVYFPPQGAPSDAGEFSNIYIEIEQL